MNGMINGLGSGNYGAVGVSVQRANGSAMTAGTTRKSSSQSKKTRKLQYNFMEVSAEILQAKTSGNANRVFILARSKVAGLRQKKLTGQYNESEVESAILHAEAMVRVARKRMKHLKAEEQAKRGEKSPVEEWEEQEEELDLTAFTDPESEMQDEMREIEQEMAREIAREMQRLMEETMEETLQETAKAMEDTLELAELSEDLAGAMDEMEPEDLEQLKKKHRAEEQREIMEADMKYLKAMFDRLAKEKQSGSGGMSFGNADSADTGSVSLELGGTEIPVADVAAVAEVAGGNVDCAV